MAQYLLSVHYVEGQPEPAPDEMEQMFKDVGEINEEMTRTGAWVFGGGLQSPDTSTVVRERDGEIVVTDGPFPEAKEQIAGFWIIEAPDLDAAQGWARKATVACRGPVEVRPFDNRTAEEMLGRDPEA